MEGCEAILAGADALLARCAVHGTRRVELGMAHRGRLAMLSTLLNKPPGTLFAKMENAQSDYAVGDVTYHLGETATLTYGQVHSPQLAGQSLDGSANQPRRLPQQASISWLIQSRIRLPVLCSRVAPPQACASLRISKDACGLRAA